MDINIKITSMRQLAHAVDKDDDWTGLTDAAARKKRQNRLNVRAYRRRKFQASHPQTQAYSVPSVGTSAIQVCWNEAQQRIIITRLSKATSDPRKPLFPSCEASHQTDILLPLSSDHLITLVQYNVLRACIANLQIMSILEDIVVTDCVEVLRILPPAKPGPNGQAIVPLSLQPTPLQNSVVHPQWIDIVPSPKWRDNLILALGMFDEDELFNDTVGGLWDGFPHSECMERGVIAWSPPWDANGWEVSEGFWRKWGWTLKGCNDILESSNRWREMRGEDPLAVDFNLML